MAKIAILVEKIYEDLELQYPRLRLKEAGHTVDVIGPKAGETYVGKHGYPQKAEKAATDVKAADYDLIVIPGGIVARPHAPRRRHGPPRPRRRRQGNPHGRHLPRPVDALLHRRPARPPLHQLHVASSTTSSTPAASGSTKNASSTATSSPPAAPTTCPPSCNAILQLVSGEKPTGRRANRSRRVGDGNDPRFVAGMN